ncbi:hypothetical protein [Arsenicicoccus piscis]|uniref:hypothetical protein n=1 Tax=Arsenicicoccus piscis TaxID=673954 RepID=UPI0032AEA935
MDAENAAAESATTESVTTESDTTVDVVVIGGGPAGRTPRSTPSRAATGRP